jgi:hypothetical protein
LSSSSSSDDSSSTLDSSPDALGPSEPRFRFGESGRLLSGADEASEDGESSSSAADLAFVGVAFDLSADVGSMVVFFSFSRTSPPESLSDIVFGYQLPDADQ